RGESSDQTVKKSEIAAEECPEKTLGEVALELFRQQTPRIGFQNLPGAVRVNSDGLALLLVLKDEDDAIILGSDNGQDLIDVAVERVAAKSLTVAGRQFRPLAETLNTTRFPEQALSSKAEEREKWLCDNYAQAARAIHLNSGIITLTTSKMRACVVTRC